MCIRCDRHILATCTKQNEGLYHLRSFNVNIHTQQLKMDNAKARLNKVCCTFYHLHSCLVYLLIFAVHIFQNVWILRFSLVLLSYLLYLIIRIRLIVCIGFYMRWFISANVVQVVPEQTADELSAPISKTPMLTVLRTPGLNMPITPAKTI